MPLASSPSTSKRLLTLLSLLQSRRDWPAPVLAARLEVSARTVRRDIERLRELDYAIDATRGPDGGYRLEAGSTLPPLLFDDEQVIALTLALRTAGSLGAGVEEAAERALGTVSRLMPARLAHRVASLAHTSSRTGAVQADPAVLLRIGESILDTEELRFDYASPDASDAPHPPPVRSVQPHHLLLHGGRWYLLGYSPADADWRIFRVDRITPRSHNGRRFSPQHVPGGDPARFLAARFKGSTGADDWPCRGEALLHAPLAEIAPYLGDGTVESVAPDRCRVRVGSWSWGGLAAELCRFTVALSDVEPAELRAALSSLSERAAAGAATADASG
ncbi:WYL domain-containing protein [Herbiconiux sp. CPCC 203407]|uniref:WYL domain-containing protein n=1 Tax=Herbiconiux oxytropis TaxID=2970915 RepID=A0AA42BX07_9MICO|nr:WYL domain-containing protein [Herbiconiux oxytropis]MCS5723296.1 WYL domain-containing protein [Herbiconiux oxytropis]MCS5727838.1 WYL domain-containing protein [Herbiconiux oxytropis]